jgi:cystathionine beta-lyase/cystathionine gamma-synthase
VSYGGQHHNSQICKLREDGGTLSNMENDASRRLRLGTRIVHAGRAQDPGIARPLVQPLYQSTVFAFDSVAQLDSIYEQRAAGHVYYRMGTPNTAALERSIADLEGGQAAVAAASGMGAISSLVLALAEHGEHIVADRHAYGGTFSLLTQELPRLGIEVTLVDVDDFDAVAAAFRPKTRAVLVETLTNPTLRVVDVPRIVELGRSRGVPVIVDNTFTTPYLIRPLELGADVVWHSLAKYLGGHSGAMGGIVAGRADVVEAARAKVVHFGGSLGPFDAWMVGQGLPTLSLRMRAHCENALVVARFLSERSEVSRVLYPGLTSHPGHEVASRLFSRGFGGMVSFSLRGGRGAAERFLEALELIAFAPSLADVTTTISYPVATSHRGLSADALNRMGIDEGMLRLSVGIEEAEDILADLTVALEHRVRGGK